MSRNTQRADGSFRAQNQLSDIQIFNTVMCLSRNLFEGMSVKVDLNAAASKGTGLVAVSVYYS